MRWNTLGFKDPPQCFSWLILGWDFPLPQESLLRVISMCHYSLYAAFYMQDHGDILFAQDEANVTSLHPSFGKRLFCFLFYFIAKVVW